MEFWFFGTNIALDGKYVSEVLIELYNTFSVLGGIKSHSTVSCESTP